VRSYLANEELLKKIEVDQEDWLAMSDDVREFKLETAKTLNS